jgi:hypothetical protein
MNTLHFGNWLCFHLQVRIPVLLDPVKGADPRIGISPLLLYLTEYAFSTLEQTLLPDVDYFLW